MTSNTLPDGLLVGWYGDDFTGSAAVLEVLSFAGVASVLFNEIPTSGQLARFPDVRCIGIASTARAQSPEWMDAHLIPVYEFFAAQKAHIIHFKVCSTLDSSPSLGSIGRATDIAIPVFGNGPVPCLIAAPVMQRYQAFGHLFAGSSEGVQRLDRHPVMSRHPVTPMDESDVACHLSKQTDLSFGLIDVIALKSDPQKTLGTLAEQGKMVVSLDAMSDQDMSTNGCLIWENRDTSPFCIGSQGIEYALVAHWNETGLLAHQTQTEGAGPVDRIVAVSGSVSEVTAKQIDWAQENGFATIPLDATALALKDSGAEKIAIESAVLALKNGRDPLIFSARGPNDPGIQKLQYAIENNNISKTTANENIGAALGRILATVLRKTGVRRAIISGGDTSGYATQQLGLFAFTALAPTIPGAALLQAHSENPEWDGLQLALKGGQMGSPDYFGWIKRGGGIASQGEEK